MASILGLIVDSEEVVSKFAEVNDQAIDKPDNGSTYEAPFDLESVLNTDHAIIVGIATDISLVAFFDPVNLSHRFRDDPDWYVSDTELLKEMNRGNSLFLSTGRDGYYDVMLHRSPPRIKGDSFKARMVCDQNIFYIGGYIEDGMQHKKAGFGGEFIRCPTGFYDFWITRKRDLIDVAIERADSWERNQFVQLPMLDG